jgi:hypothetical protein
MRLTKPDSKLLPLLTFFLMVSAVLACNLSKILNKSNLFEGTAMQDAAAAFQTKLGGGPIKALSLEIETDSAKLRAQDPKNLQHIDEYVYSRGFVIGPKPVQLNTMERNLDSTLFDLDQVNLAATPALAKAAVERTNLEGGKVTKMEIERGVNMSAVLDRSASDLTKSGGVQWTISVQGSREQASVVADNKGEIKRVDLSQTARAANFNYYEGDAMSKAASQIKEAFGGHVKLLELIVYNKSVFLKAQDPQKPGEFNRYKCDINGVSRDQALDKLELHSYLGRDKKVDDSFFFDLDEVNLAKTSELAKTTLDKLQIDSGHVSLMNISRRPLTISGDDKQIKWEISVSGARQKSGYVVYDSQGNQKSVKPAE